MLTHASAIVLITVVAYPSSTRAALGIRSVSTNASPGSHHPLQASNADFLFSADAGPGVGEMVERPARLFRAGHYPDKNLHLTPDSLDSIVALSSKTELIPFDFSWHGKSYDVLGPLGGILGDSLKRDGDWILGTARLPRSLDESLKCRCLSVRLDGKTKAITDVAVLPKGRVQDAAFAVDQLPNGDFCFMEGEMIPEATEEADSSTSVQAVLDALRGVGMDLPEDTTDANLKERIVVAARAMASATKENEEPVQAKEHEHPAPIAMGEENKDMSDIKFSEPQMTLPPSLRKAYRRAYATRIQGLVNSRRITAKYANETLAKHLGQTENDFTFSVSDNGDVSNPVLDTILDGLEQLPEGCVLTGPLPETDRRNRAKGRAPGDVQFKLALPEHEEDPDTLLGDDPKEQADVTKEMIEMSGGQAKAS